MTVGTSVERVAPPAAARHAVVEDVASLERRPEHRGHRLDRPVGAADEDLPGGLVAIRVMDSGFDPARFAETARDVFVRVQVAWNARDLSPVRAELTDELAASLEADAARLRTLHRLNRLEKLNVQASEVTEAWQESGRDFVTVRFRASGVDYTVDETTGAVVDGNASIPTSFEEYWTFTRPVGPNAWRLSAIQQPPA